MFTRDFQYRKAFLIRKLEIMESRPYGRSENDEAMSRGVFKKRWSQKMEDKAD